MYIWQTGEGWEGREEKKENMRERERQMAKVLDMAMHYFFMVPYYIRKFQKRFFLLLLLLSFGR